MDTVLILCVFALAGATGLSIGLAVALLLNRKVDRAH